jgi:hypothetical protein
MESICDITKPFDFSNLVLAKPISLGAGNFFIRFLNNQSNLYIQSPKCLTKQGIQKIGKIYYTDLMFSNEHYSFIQWIENLESHCHKSIFENREKWFEGDMSLHDIENYFTPVLKVYKSGKYYSIRTGINSPLGNPVLKIYDEDENDISIDTIDDKTNIITILEIKGIKCSPRSFHIDIELKQMMVLKEVDLFNNCLLKKNIQPKEQDIQPVVTEEQATSILEEQDDGKNIQEEKDLETFDQKVVEKELQEQEDNTLITNVTLEPVDVINQPESIINTDGIEEVEFNLDELPDTDRVHIVKRNQVYYQLYKNAKKKAKIARDFALSSYLEAKEIKNKYMLDDLDDTDDSEFELDQDNNDLQE